MMSSGMPSRMWFSSHSNVWSSVESEREGGAEGDRGETGGKTWWGGEWRRVVWRGGLV